jgi:hypothetical protein
MACQLVALTVIIHCCAQQVRRSRPTVPPPTMRARTHSPYGDCVKSLGAMHGGRCKWSDTSTCSSVRVTTRNVTLELKAWVQCNLVCLPALMSALLVKRGEAETSGQRSSANARCPPLPLTYINALPIIHLHHILLKYISSRLYLR